METNEIHLWLGSVINFYSDMLIITRRVIQYVLEIFYSIPLLPRYFIISIIFFAVLGILKSHLIGVVINVDKWKNIPDTKLSYSYFCGTGQYQRKKIYHDAYELLFDRKLIKMSFSGLSHKFGVYVHPSNIVLFVYSILYLPLLLLGYSEISLRIIIGTPLFGFFNFFHFTILLILNLVAYALIIFMQIIDRMLRVEQYCSKCYTKFNLPGFKCPNCGVVHNNLTSNKSGILIAKCQCGMFISSSIFSGRSELDAVCQKCNSDIAEANAKQFSIQLIGGNSSGKTAYLAAFHHQYLIGNTTSDKIKITGKSESDMNMLEQMYENGLTEPSSRESIVSYNFVHKFGRIKKHNLVICDIPDEIIISGGYEKNPLYFGYTDGIIIIIDPLSTKSVRNECIKNGDTKCLENYSMDNIETLIIRFINQFSEIVGRSASSMLSTPVSILITKTDIKAIKREVGAPIITHKFKTNPALYDNNFEYARNQLCREYLANLGLINTVNNLESVFSNINYFSASAIGHLPERGMSFEPVSIIDPILWITKEKRTIYYQIMQNMSKNN